MKGFEYEISKHPSDQFRQVVYFCSASGECNLNEVPADQAQLLVEILNERGKEGWELIQVSFGNDGMIAFWKRALKAP